MGRNKRKYDNMNEEQIMKKIRKLKEKLQEKQKSPRQITQENHNDNESIYLPPSEWAGSVSPIEEQFMLEPEEIIEQDEQREAYTQSPQPGPSSAPETSLEPTPAAEETENDLDETLLTLLGDAPKPEATFGNNIHKDVASRWQELLAKGLPKEIKEKLISEYTIPANCGLLVPPALNPEVKAALPETLIKRDFSLMTRQKNIAAALAALGKAIDLLLSNSFSMENSSKEKLLKPLSDASRLLCESHHIETKTRRSFVISSVNNNLKGALIDTSRDKFLFGENFTEKINNAKTIQKSGDALRNTFRLQSQRNTANKEKQNRSNFKALHPRQTANRFDAGPGRQTAYRAAPVNRSQQPQPPPPRRTRSPLPPPPPPPRRPQQHQYRR